MTDVPREEALAVATPASNLRQGILAVLVGFVLLLSTQLWLSRVESSKRLHIDATRIRVTAPREDLLRLGAGALQGLRLLPEGGMPLFDPDLKAVIEADLKKHPLVLGLRSFERRFAEGMPRIEVDLELRKPYASVVAEPEVLLVDRDGRYLCRVTSAEQSRGLPRIEIDLKGIASPKPLSRTADARSARLVLEATLAALDLLKHFERKDVRRHAVFEWVRFRKLRVSAPPNMGVSGELSLELELADGPTIIFGHSPSAIYGGGLEGLLKQLDRLQSVKATKDNFWRIPSVDVSVSSPEFESAERSR